jgi:hypothetical protein
MSEHDNGGTKQIRGAQLVLTLDYDTGELSISGVVRNTNEGLSMLAQATRELEYRWRAQRAADELAHPGDAMTGFLRGIARRA